MSRYILNLGCGVNQRVKDAVNVDVQEYPGVDQVVDLKHYPWPWKDESVDGIHASHIIEHLPDQEEFIWECLRILKKGGYLKLNLPHSSNVASTGCMGHQRTYSYSTMDGYLGRDFYMFGKQKFKTVEQKLRWWYEVRDAQGELSPLMERCIYLVDNILTPLANISPRVCENLWCYWIGGMREVIWKGVKL